MPRVGLSPISSVSGLLQTIVRSFLRDDHVVDVRLLESGGADADEARLLVKLADVAAARVAHAGAQAADELRHHVGERALVGDAPLDAFRDEFRLDLDLVLRVTILRAFAHRADGTHAAVGFERAALE